MKRKKFYRKNINWVSEEGNDRWVAEIFNFKKHGFFVEGGTTCGINNSAFSLEKYLHWNGICVNANEDHVQNITATNPRKNLEYAALWDSDGVVDFYYNKFKTFDQEKRSFNGVKQDLSYESAVVGVEHNFSKESLQKNSTIVQVPSITLESLLKKYNAPDVIDYVGLDIEGSEYNVLKVFPFHKYKILTMSVELSDNIQSHLEENGFTRVINPFCPKPWEHHYVNNDIIEDYPYEIWKK